MRVEGQIRRIEEDDLPDLRVEGIHVEGGDRRATIGIGHAQLELDTICALDQTQDLGELLSRQRLVRFNHSARLPGNDGRDLSSGRPLVVRKHARDYFESNGRALPGGTHHKRRAVPAC